MKFEIAPLPYDESALEPHISAETLRIHHDRHHAGYMAKLKEAIEGKPDGERSLDSLVRDSSGDLYDLAGQVWNHDFYWHSMKPGGGGQPEGALLRAIGEAFHSFDRFRETFIETAVGCFGSGWVWLVVDANERLQVRSTSNADNPIRRGLYPLLTLDVWEHAYYVDYRNERKRYAETFLDELVNWDFAMQRFERARSKG
jgi:Fe-Mn family superoxide dismutase